MLICYSVIADYRILLLRHYQLLRHICIPFNLLFPKVQLIFLSRVVFQKNQRPPANFMFQTNKISTEEDHSDRNRSGE